MKKNNLATIIYCLTIICLNISFSQNTNQGNGNQQWKINGNIADENHYFGTKNAFSLKLRSNDIERMRITPNGLVGIGLTEPEATLDVNGSVILRESLRLVNLNEDLIGDEEIVVIGSNGQVKKLTSDALNAMVYKDKFACGTLFEAEIFNNPNWANGPNKIFTRCPQIFVGIATDAPRVNLDVEGTIYGKQLSFGSIDPSAISDNLFTGKAYNNNPNKNIFNILGSNNDVLFRMNNRGNMGLATENPRVKLDVLGTSYSEKIAFGNINPNQIENYTFVGKANNGLPNQNAFTILGADNSSFLNVANTGKVSVGTSTSTDAKFSVNMNAGVSGDKAFVSNYAAAGDYSYANIFNVNRDLTKALAVINTTTNKENIVLFGDGTANVRKMNINSEYPSENSSTLFLIQNNEKMLFKVDNLGTLRARRVLVNQEEWADFVFDIEYKLMPLKELEMYIDKNKHLPDVPNEEEVLEKGTDLAEMNKILLQKVEELTLYLLEQNKKMEEQAAEILKIKSLLK